MALVEAGYMGVRKNHPLAGGDDGFWVTEAGKRAAVENSPSPPKLSRAKQRYQDWLDDDSSRVSPRRSPPEPPNSSRPRRLFLSKTRQR
jgi:hypothetical protein